MVLDEEAKAMNEVDAGRDRRGLFQCKRLEVKGGSRGGGGGVCVCVCVCVCVLAYRHGVRKMRLQERQDRMW